MIRIETMQEWSERTLPPEAVPLLGEDGWRAAKRLNQNGVAEILKMANGIRIRTNSHVGRINLGGFVLHVKPKLSGLPLMQLLKYAYGLDDLRLFDQARYNLEDFALHELVICALLSHAEKIMRRGFFKGYTAREDDLSALRGRIVANRLVANGGLIGSTLPCRYHWRNENVLLNRVLLAGLALARRMTSDAGMRLDLQRATALLSKSVSGIELSPATLAAAEGGVNRLTEEYGPALEFIAILYRMQAPGIDRDGNTTVLPGYFFDMNSFFETLVSRFLKTLPERYSVLDQYRLAHVFAYNGKHNPKRRSRPTPRPDFALCEDGKVERLLDAKYRDLWNTQLPPGMLYQLAMYAVSGIGNKTATILYPVLPEPAEQPRLQVIDMHNPIDGSRIAQVHLCPLDLLHIHQLIESGDRRAVSGYMTRALFEA